MSPVPIIRGSLVVSIFLCAAVFVGASKDVTKSGIITVGGRTELDALKRMVNSLNVAVPEQWPNYMSEIDVQGQMDAKIVTLENYEEYVDSWPVDIALKNEVGEASKLLILSADSSFKAELIKIDRQGRLVSVIVAVRQVQGSETDVVMVYMIVTSTANIKQQFDAVEYQYCRECRTWIFFTKCCWETRIRHDPRGLTVSELAIILNRLTLEQFHFGQKYLNSLPQRETVKFKGGDEHGKLTTWSKLVRAMVNYSRDLDVQENIANFDQSSFVQNLKPHIKSLFAGYQTLSLKKVSHLNLLKVLKVLGSKYDFNLNYTDEMQQKLEKDTFVLEKLKSEGDTVIYTMIVLVKNGTYYDISTSHTKSNIQSMPPLVLSISSTVHEVSFPYDEEIDVESDSDLQLDEIKIMIQTFRWFGIKKLLSEISPDLDPVFMPYALTVVDYTGAIGSPIPAFGVVEVAALASALSAVAKTWENIASAFKTTSNTKVENIVRLGFDHFKLDSKVVFLKGFPMDKLDSLADYIFKKFDVPDAMKIDRDDLLIFGLAEDGSVWDEMTSLYSKDNSGNCNHLQILKNPNKEMTKSNWMISTFKTDFAIAPDLLVKTTSRSILGGIFESEKMEIMKQPHVLIPADILQITKFLEIAAYGRVAAELGIKLSFPEIKKE